MARRKVETIKEIFDRYGFDEGDERFIKELEDKFSPYKNFVNAFTTWTQDETGTGGPTFDAVMAAWEKCLRQD